MQRSRAVAGRGGDASGVVRRETVWSVCLCVDGMIEQKRGARRTWCVSPFPSTQGLVRFAYWRRS